MKCPKCGKEVPDSAKVCGYCGHRLGDITQKPDQNQLPTPTYSVQQTHPQMQVATQPQKINIPAVSKSGLPGLVWFFLGLVVVAIPVVLVAVGVIKLPHSSPQPVQVVVITQVPGVTTLIVSNKTATATAMPTVTNTPKPTSTRKPTPTEIEPPTEPEFLAFVNMFCRAGPGSDYVKHWMVEEGQTVPVIARWSNNWLLVGIDDSRTRTKCCWIGGDGELNVNMSEITEIDYLPDRMHCLIMP
jgi:hypothetical protein